MPLIEQAVAALADTEARLQRLIEDGLKIKSYDEVARVAEMASVLRFLIERQKVPPGVAGSTESNSLVRHQEASLEVERAVRIPVSMADTPERRSHLPAPAETYPRFERDKTKLIKVGWSDREKRAY